MPYALVDDECTPRIKNFAKSFFYLGGGDGAL